MNKTRIFNKDKTIELQNVDLTKGYLKNGSLLIKHHEGKPENERKVIADYPYDEVEHIQIYIEYTLEEQKNILRQKRETECYSIINRGQLWYNRLTSEQITELNTWYQAWLDVTDTMTIPIKLSWIK